MMLLRNSERQTFKRCRHRWQWTYLEGREPIEAAHALRFGDLVHQSMEKYYKPGRKRGPHPAKTFAELYHEQAKAMQDGGFDAYNDDRWIDALDLGVGMLEGYVDRYKVEDREYEIICSEQVFQVALKTEPVILTPGEKPRRVSFKVVGTIDGVWRHIKSKSVVFKEFKTAASIKTGGLAMDEQPSVYWTYGPKYLRKLGILKPDEMPRSILYTFLRKAIPNPDYTYDDQGRKLNKDGSVSKQQPAPYFERLPVYRDEATREIMHKRILAEAGEIAKARAGSLPLYKNPGPLHMPNCSGCSVKDACELHEVGADFESVLEMTMKPWNPYAAHELAERY